MRTQGIPKILRWIVPVLAGVVISATTASAATWHVYNISDLNTAESNHGSGDEIILYPNTYQLSQYLNLNKSNVTFRGSTGNPDDVIIRGQGMNVQSGPLNGLMIENDNITVRDLTIKDILYNGIQIRGEWDVDNAVISNVKTVNIGQRHIKCSWSSSTTSVPDNILIENVQMLQTEPRQVVPSDPPYAPGDYIGGIDAGNTNGFTVRDCYAEGIQGVSGGGRAAIFFWQANTNTTVERNIIVDCDRGIAMGNPAGPSHARTGDWCMINGLARNNLIKLHGTDAGFELCYTKDTEIYNNTLYADDPSYFRAVHLNGASTTNLDSRYNLIRGAVYENGASWSDTGSIIGAAVAPEWFVDPATGMLFLTELASGALDGAQTLAEIYEDVHGGPRPVGAFPDVGGDEYGSPAGDANYDGRVDGLDYVIWSNNYWQSGNWGDANFNADAFVDGLDYVIWSNNYGFGYQQPPGGAVPEPGCLLLLLAAGPFLLRRRRQA